MSRCSPRQGLRLQRSGLLPLPTNLPHATCLSHAALLPPLLPRVDLSPILLGLLILNTTPEVAKTHSALWGLFPLAHLCPVQAWELSHDISFQVSEQEIQPCSRVDGNRHIPQWAFRGEKTTSKMFLQILIFTGVFNSPCPYFPATNYHLTK